MPSTGNRSPSKDRDAAENPTVGVRMTRAQRDALAARAEAAGVSMGALLLSGLADKDQAVAAAHDEGFTEGAARQREADARHLAALDRDHQRALAALRRDHKAGLTAAAKQAQLAVEAAYQRGLAEADPAQIARAEEARDVARSWQVGVTALLRHFEARGEMLLTRAEPSTRVTVERLLDAQERAVQLAFGRQADNVPLPRQLAAAVAAAVEDEDALLSHVAGKRIAQLQRDHADAVAKLQQQLAELADVPDQLVETQAKLSTTQRALDAAQAEAAGVRAQMQGLTGQLEAAQRSPRLQLMAWHRDQMEQMSIERKAQQREWEERRGARSVSIP